MIVRRRLIDADGAVHVCGQIDAPTRRDDDITAWLSSRSDEEERNDES